MGRDTFRRAVATATWHFHPARRGRAYRFLQRSQWLAREELERVQLAALNDVLRAAREIPFYRERLEQGAIGAEGVRSLGELSRLRPTERADFQQLGVAGLRRGRQLAISRKTSGSTGQPVQTIWPLEMMAWVDATERRSQAWLGIRPGMRRLTVHPVFEHVRLLRRVKRRLMNSSRIDLSALTDRPALEELIDSLADDPPVVILGSTPGAICELARALDGPWPYPTNAVVTSGTRLHPHQKALIEQVFRCAAYERYGSIETGLISHPCREAGQQHLASEVVLLEVVRDDGTPAAPDEVGHVLVTCLRNRAMPLLRYRLGDLASLSPDPCPCGRGLPLLKRLVGRTIEKLVTADGGIVVPEIAVHAVLDAAEDSLLEFKIVQHDDLRVQLQVIQRDHPEPEAVRARLAEIFDGLVGLPGTTVVERVARLPLGPAGKLNVIVSHVADQP